MRIWAWLLPCWVWKCFFAQFPRQTVQLDGRTRFLVRLDEEFALVYDPQRTPAVISSGMYRETDAIRMPLAIGDR